MGSDLISRKTLLKAMDDAEELMEEAMCIPSWATAKECVRTVKPVDAVEMVHGEWRIMTSGIIYCPVCYKYALLNGNEDYFPSKYCPNCGAKMDGGSDEL